MIEEIKKLSKDDIQDLFHNFRDRMKIRNYIKDNQESDLETGIAETESTQSEMSDESPIANSMKISSAKFTSQQLLERKRGKVKSSEALSFFNN